jgi:hypothetical protein
MQRGLDWAHAEKVGYHHLRHTMARFSIRTTSRSTSGIPSHYRLGSEWLRRGTLTELARALSDLMSHEHPLVHGVKKCPLATLRRFGRKE